MPYRIVYVVACINAAIGAIASVLSGAYLAVHPSWLTQDVALTCGIIVVPITLALANFLPPITRTPARREFKYLAAMAGALPEDLAKKHDVSPQQEVLK